MSYQLPNARTSVTYLLDSIKKNDPGIQAVMAQVRTDTARMNDFEATASYIIPYNPVSKKRISNMKVVATNTSDTTVSVIYAADGKVAPGGKGVGFRIYDRPIYNTLTKEHKDELLDIRSKHMKGCAHQGKNKKAKWDNKSTKKIISEAISNKLESKGKQGESSATNGVNMHSYISSVINSLAAEGTP